ncbi:MAG: trypsin-like peptidase domain-containing protein [Gammaproteobacteria bacterium]|nr:trypsin-like peptidase domain-containing protein [Gammaproteobacteria bacterium]
MNRQPGHADHPPPRKSGAVLLCATIGFSLAAAMAHADIEAQNAFSEANRYTVKINASTEYSFIERESGSWTGAGFLVDRQRRWVLTNAHVAGYVQTTLQANFKNQPSRPARALFVDNLLDVAVIELAEGAVPAEASEARLACGRVPPVGSDLGAFGHPLGYAFTATRGIMAGVTYSEGYPMIQTDTPISPGNSGGPLIDLASGEVVGINTASVGDKRAQNVNFAVMIPHACRILELLRDGKPATTPKVTTDFAADEDDVLTLTVARTPALADGFGLLAGDTVLGIADDPRQFASAAEMVLALRGRAGNIPLRVQRNGREITLSTALTPSLQHVGRTGLAISGVVFAPRLLSEVSTPDEAGVLIVHQVEPGSTGDLHQISYGLEVTSVDGQRITRLSQLRVLAETAAREKRDLRLMLRSVSDDGVAMELFRVRDLPVDTIEVYPPE